MSDFTAREIADELVNRLGHGPLCEQIGVATLDELLQRADAYDRG